MKLYGSKRAYAQTCKYGCCGAKESHVMRHTLRGRAAKKAAKHRARQEARKTIKEAA